jgi:hypothetical protein
LSKTIQFKNKSQKHQKMAFICPPLNQIDLCVAKVKNIPNSLNIEMIIWKDQGIRHFIGDKKGDLKVHYFSLLYFQKMQECWVS